jgi:signal-transduction protein with cAMP-binding, CBS, and nucleotidyltransferase domain
MPFFELFLQLPLFKGVESEDLFTLVPRIALDFENYQEGELIFKKTDEPSGIVFLLKGVVKLVDEEYAKEFSGNCMISFTGIFGSERKFNADAIALTDSKTLVIDRKSMLYLFRQNDTILANYLNMTADIADSRYCIKYLDKLQRRLLNH